MIHLKEFTQETVNTFLHNPNQFASGGILLMAIGAVMATLRSIPQKIWGWIVHQTTITLTITDDHKAYYWVKSWLESQRIMKRTRHMDVMNRGSDNYILVPAPGHHWMYYRGRILSVTLSRTEEKKLGQTTRNESITLTTIGRKQTLFRDMMAEIRSQFIKKEEKKPELYAWGQWGEWREIHGYLPRPIQSVILPIGDTEKIINDVKSFRSNRAWYQDMGIPYRKGYLFYGPPGTGKTSLVAGLSSYFKSNIYILKLRDMSDTTLREAVTGIESNSFLVMEDIDTINASHDRDREEKESKNTGVTLSGLLNVIDGLFSPPGAVFVMTTNHRDKLDPALLRPGRVDLQLEISYATQDQKRRLQNRFFPGIALPTEYVDRQMTMAELQQALMEDKAKLEAK